MSGILIEKHGEDRHKCDPPRKGTAQRGSLWRNRADIRLAEANL